MGFGRCSDPTIDDATLGFGKGSDCHATSGSNQNFDPITIHAATSSNPNFDPSIYHALGFGTYSDHTTRKTSLGSDTSSGCHATLDFGTGSNPTTSHAASNSDPSSGPTTDHASLGSNPSSNPTTSHAASHNNPTHHVASRKEPTVAFFNATPSSSDSDDETQLAN